MNICKSSEDYLEMMLMLQRGKGYIRSVDIAAGLGVTKPSVSYAVKRLRENGYIEMDGTGNITLTQSGREIAEEMFNRHTILTTHLMNLGVPEDKACEDACQIEHVISDESFKAISRSVKLSGITHSCESCHIADECSKH